MAEAKHLLVNMSVGVADDFNGEALIFPSRLEFSAGIPLKGRANFRHGAKIVVTQMLERVTQDVVT